MNMDFLEACLEEIALEGLDGITLPSLWIRLETRKPEFPLKLDNASKQYIWKYLVKEDDLSFFELPKARAPLQLYNRFDYVDPETSICVEREDLPEEVYPIHIVRDGNIVGSCSTYNTRKDITERIRSSAESVHTILDRWGEQFVIVSSQKRRTVALFGPDVFPNVELVDKLYCIVERIGRARWRGEVTQGRDSLKVFDVCSKTMYYFRKILKRHNLVTVQIFNMRLNKGVNTYGKLIHLKRFYTERCPLYLGWLEKLTRALDEKPNKREVVNVMRSEISINQKVFKKLYQMGDKYVEVDLMLHREVYPEATAEEYLTKNTGHERFIRVIKLKKLFKYRPGHGLDDADEENDSDSSDDETKTGDEAVKYDRVVEEPLLRQAYKFVRERKEQGASQLEMSKAFGVTTLDARLLCRNLERLDKVKKVMRDVGRQKVHSFVANDYLEQSKEHQKFTQMKEEIIAEDEVKHREKMERAQKRNKSAYVTFRTLKRAKMVLEMVSENKLVDNLFLIKKKIIEEEEKEGIKTKFDKKSMMRIIDRLVDEKKLQLYKPVVSVGDEEKELLFVIDPSVNLNDPFVNSAVEAAKCRHMAISNKAAAQDTTLIQQTADVDNPNFNLLKSKLKSRHMKYDSDAGRRYGFANKMRRTSILHKLVWYLAYGYNEQSVFSADIDEKLDQHQANYEYLGAGSTNEGGNSDFRVHSATHTSQMDKDGILKNIKVYRDEYTWRRFVPPVPTHKGKDPGWIMFGDILLRMPLSMYFQLVRFNFKDEALDEYLSHPVKRYLTISQIPHTMRQQLMIGRKYIHSSYEILTIMCGMGLLSFGVKGVKEKEQVFMYLHKNLTMLDTRSSETKLSIDFTLNSFKELNSFWYNLEVICLNTNTDNMDTDKVERVSKGLSAYPRFREALREKRPEEIVDDGTVPGDRLGVAGLDSGFYAHLRRNWYMNPDASLNVSQSRNLDGKGTVMDTDSDVEDNDVTMDSDSEGEETKTSLTKGKTSKKQKAKSSGKKHTTEDMDESIDKKGIWLYFDQINPVQTGNQTSARCKLCGRELKQWKNAVPLVMHIKRQHKEIKNLPEINLGDKEIKESLVTDFLLLPFQKEDKKTKKRRRCSSVWRYLENTEDSNRVKCLICDVILFFAGKSTTHLKRHLLRFHADYIIETEGLDAPENINRTEEVENSSSTSASQVETAVVVDQSKVSPGGKVGVKHKPKSHLSIEPKRKRRRKLGAQSKNYLSRAPYHDEIDKAALKLKTKERVNWTPQEDSLLLLCYVAHVIMVGERRDFIVPFACIRDLMHRSFLTSADKTSKACQRRLRYMLKQKDTISSVHAFVGEAIMDQDIFDNFKKGKQYVKGRGTARCEKFFLKLVSKLRDKFKSNTTVPIQVLPDSLAQVNNDYEIVMPDAKMPLRHKDPSSQQDIHSSVLHHVIHSAMLLSDKSNYTFHLYQIFQQYPESLLMSVFFSMRDDQMISKIKRYVKESPRAMLKSTTIPSVSMGAYQMAQKYTYNWYTKYPRIVFLEADEKISELTLQRHKESENKGEEESANNPNITTSDTGGYCSVVVALMALRKLSFETILPKDIIVLDTSYSERMSSEKQSRKRVKRSLGLGTTESDEEEDKLIEEAQNEGNESGKKEQPLGAARVNLTLARNKNRDVVHLAPTDHVVIKSCTVNISLIAADESRSTLEEDFDHGVEAENAMAAYNSTKNMFLHPKTCTVVLDKFRFYMPTKVDMKACWNYMDELHITEEDKNAMRNIYEYVKKREISGITSVEMKEKFGHLAELGKYLGLFEAQRMIMRVGVSVHRYVCHEFVRPWIVHSYRTQQSDTPSSALGEADHTGDIHTSWMDEVLLTGSSYNPYKKAADVGYLRKAERKRKEREEKEKLYPWLVTEDAPDNPGQKLLNTKEKLHEGGDTSMEDNGAASTEDSTPATEQGGAATSAQNNVSTSAEDTAQIQDMVLEGEESKHVTLVKCTSSIKVPEYQGLALEIKKDDKPRAKKRKLSTTDDDSDMEAVTYEDDQLEEEQTALKVKPILDQNSTFSAGGARIRLPKPVLVNPPILQPVIPIGSGARVRYPVNLGPQLKSPPLPEILGLPESDNTEISAVTEEIASSPSQDSVVFSPYKSVTTKTQTNAPSVITISATSNVTSTAQNIDNQGTTSAPLVVPSVSLTKSKSTPVPIAPAGCAVLTLTTSSHLQSSPSGIVVSSPSSTGTSRGIPTVAIQPGNMALIFPPNQPLRLPSPTKVPPANLPPVTRQGIRSPPPPSRVITIPSPASATIHSQPTSPGCDTLISPPSVKKMKISYTGEVEMVDVPVVKATTIVKKKTIMKATTYPPSTSGVTSPTVQSPKGGSDISKKLESYIMSSLKDSFKGIDTSKVVVKIPDSVKIPRDKDGNPVKLKIMTTDQAQKEGVLNTGSASATPSTSVTGTSPPRQGLSAASTLVSPAQSHQQTQSTGAVTRSREAVSILRKLPGPTTSGGVGNPVPNPRSLLKASVAKAASSPRTRSSSRSASSADEDLPQTDGPADEKRSGDETKKDDTRSNTETGKSSVANGNGSSSQPKVYQKIRIIPRPWRTPDGAINRPILRMMLEGIVAFLLTKPGVTYNQLVEKYNPILQPVCLVEVLEILICIGCIKKEMFHRKEKPSLFSKRPVYHADEFEKATSVITYTPTVDCVLKLGQFETQLQDTESS